MPAFTALGIDVRTGTTVERIKKTEHGYEVYASAAGTPSMIEADLVVHAAGRAPDFSELNLAAAGIETEKGLLKLNEYLRSVSNPSVYAAGDAAHMGPPLTPVASHDAKIVAANLLRGNQHKPNYLGIPTVAFTIPAIAAVGLTEAQARKKASSFARKASKHRPGLPPCNRLNRFTATRF